ncbi:MAG: SDR family oxidoreductase [Acidimicrobiia bacterium]|nr:SDR family oxidoreductase [Acidimicrobiia bacterium]
MDPSPHAPVAVVTGGSAGVGRAVVVELAHRGFDVAVLARGDAGLEATVAAVESRGRRGLAVPTDVADWERVDAAASRVEEELGEIDLWVNNAMTTVFGWSWDIEPADFKRATEVTYLGQVHGTLAALARMRPRDRGRIVSIGSALAYLGIPLQAPYCAAKFATRGFHEAVRAELIAEGSSVEISQVHLPAVNTPQFDWCKALLPGRPIPVPPIYEPEEMARHVVDIAMDMRRSRIIGAWNTGVVMATRWMPGLANHFAAATSVEGQQADEPVRTDRPSNLYEPVDADHDEGPRGRFPHEQARGGLTVDWLTTLPQTVLDLVSAGIESRRHELRRDERVRWMEDRLRRRSSMTSQ